MATKKSLFLDPKIRKTVLKAIELGLRDEDAAMFAGISTSTVTLWRHKAHEDRDDEYSDFWEDMRRAESKGKYKLLKKIRAAAQREWRAAAWILERRYPDEFGQRAVQNAQFTLEVVYVDQGKNKKAKIKEG